MITILSQLNTCYSRLVWQRPWALLDNHNCLHYLRSYMCCVSTRIVSKGSCLLAIRMTIFQRKKFTRLNLIFWQDFIRGLITEHDDKTTVKIFEEPWEKNIVIFHHKHQCLLAEPNEDKRNNTNYHSLSGVSQKHENFLHVERWALSDPLRKGTLHSAMSADSLHYVQDLR